MNPRPLGIFFIIVNTHIGKMEQDVCNYSNEMMHHYCYKCPQFCHDCSRDNEKLQQFLKTVLTSSHDM